jgi:hypothetical protein
MHQFNLGNSEEDFRVPDGDPQERSVSWLALEDGEYRPVEHSGLIDLGAQGLAEQLDWPAIQPARRHDGAPLR